MSQRGSPALVGAVVLAALALLILGVGIYGTWQLLGGGLRYVIYFEGSYGGLSVGATVMLRRVG
ncbi:MAG: MCE family protein, partial [Candidatus Competibacterales bacterium]